MFKFNLNDHDLDMLNLNYNQTNPERLDLLEGVEFEIDYGSIDF